MSPQLSALPDAAVAALVARARVAQREFETWSQERVDEAVTAAAWAIVEPGRNRALAELAVRDTGLGDVADKIAKNRRKTIGLLRDLERREIGRRHQRGPGARAHRDRAAGRRRRRDHAVDQSRRDAGEQHPQRAQRAQRDHPGAVAEGGLHARAAAGIRARRARPRRRAARSGAAARRADVPRADARADATGGSRRRHRLAVQRARRLRKRHAGARRRRRQRDGDRRRNGRRACGGREDRAFEDVRSRDVLLVREQRDRRCERIRCAAGGVRRRGRRAARGGRSAAAGSGDVRRRQARAGVRRPSRRHDRRARGARPARRSSPRGS